MVSQRSGGSGRVTEVPRCGDGKKHYTLYVTIYPVERRESPVHPATTERGPSAWKGRAPLCTETDGRVPVQTLLFGVSMVVVPSWCGTMCMSPKMFAASSCSTVSAAVARRRISTSAEALPRISQK